MRYAPLGELLLVSIDVEPIPAWFDAESGRFRGLRPAIIEELNERARQVMSRTDLARRPASEAGPSVGHPLCVEYAMDSIAALAAERGWRVPDEFPRPAVRAIVSGPPIEDTPNDSERLRALSAALGRFYTNYDPSDPSTAPTNEQVVKWLMEEKGLTMNSANAIALILRPEKLPPGPRK